MSIEATMYGLIGPFVGDRVTPDISPADPEYPLSIYQQVGGQAYWYAENAMPDHRHARIQINVWSRSRVEANTIARQIEAVIAASGLIAQPYGALVALYEEALELYGTRQDYGIWFKD